MCQKVKFCKWYKRRAVIGQQKIGRGLNLPKGTQISCDDSKGQVLVDQSTIVEWQA